MKNLPEYVVVAPIGAFGNHIRWLLLLDDQFQFDYIYPNKELYEIHRGSTWPKYENFTIKNIQKLPLNIQEEIKNKLFTDNFIFDCSNKVKFITESVYPTSRTFDNWLKYEWRFRGMLNNLIFFEHTLTDPIFKKALIITIDNDLAYKSYFKFNSWMHFGNKDDLKNRNTVSVQTNINFVNQHSIDHMIIDAGVLFNRILDYDFYKSIIDFFDLTDNYYSAKQIHEAWYDGQKRSEEEFLKTAISLYKASDK